MPQVPFLSPAVTGTGLEGAGGRNKKGWTHWPSSTCFELAALEAGELSALGIGRPGRMKSLLGFSTEKLLWKMGLSDLEPLRQTVNFGDLGGPGRGLRLVVVEATNGGFPQPLRACQILGKQPRGHLRIRPCL